MRYFKGWSSFNDPKWRWRSGNNKNNYLFRSTISWLHSRTGILHRNNSKSAQHVTSLAIICTALLLVHIKNSKYIPKFEIKDNAAYYAYSYVGVVLTFIFLKN